MATANPKRYRLFGLLIESAIALPDLVGTPIDSEVPDVTISWDPQFESVWKRVRIVQSGKGPKEVTLGLDEQGAIIIGWPTMQMRILADGTHITLFCSEQDLDLAPAALCGLGIGLLLHARDILCLHANVVRFQGRTLMLMGDSGSGKSTLSAALVARGAQFIADDLAVLEGIATGLPHVHAGFTTLRINPDSANVVLAKVIDELVPMAYGGKLQWHANEEGIEGSKVPVDDLVWVAPQGPEVACDLVKKLGSTESFRCLMRAWYPPSCFRFMTQSRMQQISTLSSTVAVNKLSYPHDWDRLGAALDALLS